MTSLELRNAQIVSEFDRYVMEHPSFAAKIPRGAQIILQLPDDPKFNTWVRRIAKKQRQPGQPAVVVHIEKLLPARSRIRSLKVDIQAA